MSDNPFFKTLEERYFQGEYVYNYGGFAPQLLFIPPTPSPSPSLTPTNTITPTITPTNTITPSITPTQSPFAVCPEEFTIVSTTNPNWNTGQYNRKYDYSGGTFEYGYVSSTSPQYNVGIAPDGNYYPVFKSVSGFDFLARSFGTSGVTPNVDFGFAQIASTGDGWNAPVSGATIINRNFFNYITISGARFPATGLQTGLGIFNYYLTYPAVCPTSTPTNTPTSTITPTITPTITSSVTPSITPTNTTTPSVTPTLTPTITSTNTQTPTNTPTPSSTPPPSGTTEANIFLEAAAQAKGSALGSTISGATTTLFTSLVSNNLWDKLNVFYPIIGGTSTTTAINGKNPGTNNITWYGGATFSADQVLGNGSNAYGDTGLSANTLSQNSVHMSNYSRTTGSTTNLDMGITIGGGTSLQMYNNQSGSMGIKVAKNNATGYSTGAVTNGAGLFTATRTGSTIENGFRDSTRVINASQTSTGLPSGKIYLMARNTASGNAEGFNNRGYAWFSIGSGLSSPDVSNYYTIIQAFQTALSRQV
jgi:hypothetical protein